MNSELINKFTNPNVYSSDQLGWPHHLFIPKGNSKGMAFDLFVMVTNFDEDFVANHPRDMEIPEPCNSPYIYCGRPMRRYPDARPMGKINISQKEEQDRLSSNNSMYGFYVQYLQVIHSTDRHILSHLSHATDTAIQWKSCCAKLLGSFSEDRLPAWKNMCLAPRIWEWQL